MVARSGHDHAGAADFALSSGVAAPKLGRSSSRRRCSRTSAASPALDEKKSLPSVFADWSLAALTPTLAAPRPVREPPQMDARC